jgi:hypothetical protein
LRKDARGQIAVAIAEDAWRKEAMRDPASDLNRRRFIKQSLTATGAGIFAGWSMEELALLARAEDEPARTATQTSGAGMPTGKIGKVLDFMRQNGLVAGVGSHSLDTPRAVEKQELNPDFYFKTFNGVGYCTQQPQQVAELMKTIDKPWIAFKVLGGGVVKPPDGFRLALKAGADFLNVGMFDFQVRENVALMRDLLARNLTRHGPWNS